MEKRGLLILLMLITISSVSAQYTVTRTIDPDSVGTGEDVTVTLSVDVGSTTDAYVVDEIYPAGWAVVDDGDGYTDQSGHLKWIVIGVTDSTDYACSGVLAPYCADDIVDIDYTYVIRAPNTEDTYDFSGDTEYMFDSQSSEQSIGGEDVIEVVGDTPTACSAYDNDQTSCESTTDDIDCAYCPLNDQCEPEEDVECTEETCDGDFRCSSSCVLRECNSDQSCINNTCVTDDDDDPPPDDDDDDSGTGGTTTTTCQEKWVCTDWAPVPCPEDTRKQTRTCTEENNCGTTNNKPATQQTCRLPRSTDTTSTTTSSSDTDRSRTSSSATTTSSSSSRSRTSSEPDVEEPKTTEEVLEENASTANSMFYILLIILVILAVGIVVYLKGKGGGGIKLNAPPQQPQQPKQPGGGIQPL